MAKCTPVVECEWPENLKPGTHYLYVMQEFSNGDVCAPVKVGVSATPFARQAALSTGNWRGLEITHLFECASRRDAFDLERDVLEAFGNDGLGGEWLNRHPDDIYQYLTR